jgi:hypothetical protein
MALTPGEGDGGTGGVLGGTASSICAISPSDLVGTLGNLITRIEQLEFQLSQVVGANLHTEQLSNISEQVGWVYGVEYMGIPGWTQTEYGTLIPPAGFTLLGSGMTLSDGNTYSAVVMDENGVLQYGFTTDGQITGSASVASVYGMVAAGFSYGGTTLAEPDQLYFKGVTRGSSAFSTASSLSPISRQETWTVGSSGLYLASMAACSEISGATGLAYSTATVSAQCSNPTPILFHTVHRPSLAPGNDEKASAEFTVTVRLNAGDSVIFSFGHGAQIETGTVAGYHAVAEHVSLVKVGSLT